MEWRICIFAIPMLSLAMSTTSAVRWGFRWRFSLFLPVFFLFFLHRYVPRVTRGTTSDERDRQDLYGNRPTEISFERLSFSDFEGYVCMYLYYTVPSFEKEITVSVKQNTRDVERVNPYSRNILFDFA